MGCSHPRDLTRQVPFSWKHLLVPELPSRPERRVPRAWRLPFLGRREGPSSSAGLLPPHQPIPQQDLPFCSPFLPGVTSTTPAHLGIFFFVIYFFRVGRSDAFVASGSRACPSARLTPHKPALSLWANWLYLSSLLGLCITQGVIRCCCCFAYLFGAGVLFFFSPPSPGPLCLSPQASIRAQRCSWALSEFGDSTALGRGRLGAGAAPVGSLRVRTPRGDAAGTGPGHRGDELRGFCNRGCWEVCCRKGLPVEAELHKLWDNLC